MRTFIIPLAIFVFLSGCQTPFESKTQAKNEVNKLGFRDGRWVDYLDADGNKTNGDINYDSYVLSEYKDGKPIGYYKEYNKDNSLKSTGTFKSDAASYEKNSMPTQVVGSVVHYSQDKIEEKDLYDSFGNLVRKVYFWNNTETNSRDSGVFSYKYYPSNEVKSVLIEVNEGNSLIEYDEDSWTKGVKGADKFVDMFIDAYEIPKKELIESTEIPYSKGFKERAAGIYYGRSAIENVHYITNEDNERNDQRKYWLDTFQKWNRSKNSSASTGARNGSILSCTALSDNLEALIGKTITVQLGYASTLNENFNLQCGEISYERAYSVYSNISSGLDEYYTRIGDCARGTNFILRIPYTIGQKVPNMRSGYIVVTGVLKDRRTIIVSSIRR